MYFAFNQFFFLEGEIYILLKRKDPQIQLSTASGNPFQFSILSRNMLRPTMWNTALRSNKKANWNFSTVCSFVTFLRAASTLWCQLPETGEHHTNCWGPRGLYEKKKYFPSLCLKNAMFHTSQNPAIFIIIGSPCSGNSWKEEKTKNIISSA